MGGLVPSFFSERGKFVFLGMSEKIVEFCIKKGNTLYTNFVELAPNL